MTRRPKKTLPIEPDPWEIEEVAEQPAPEVPVRLTPREKPDEYAQMGASEDDWVVIYPEKNRPINQLDLRMEEGHRKFLTVLAKTGSFRKAQIASGLGERALYLARQKFPDFARNWQMAMDIFLMFVAEEKIRHRVIDGTLEPITYQGQITGYKRVYDSGLTQFWYKANMREKYGEKSEIAISGNINHGVAVLPARATDLDAWEREAAKTLENQKRNMIDITPTNVDAKPVAAQNTRQTRIER
jgi:hypothetical protein